MQHGRCWVVLLLLLSLMAGCQEPPPKTTKTTITATTSLTAIPWSEAPETLFQDRATGSWADALEGSATYYRTLKPDRLFRFGPSTLSAQAMARACAELAAVARQENPDTLRETLHKRFRLFRSVGSDGDGHVLVTGYYEPLLHGSLTRSARYFQPLYRRPPDLLTLNLALWSDTWKGKQLMGRIDGRTVRPYFDREAIDGHLFPIGQAGPPPPQNPPSTGILDGHELVWVDSAIDAFFLHIQGSGRVQLDTPSQDGTPQVLRVGYAGANGRPYRSIGKILIDEGRIPRKEMTMPRLSQWLHDNPGELERVLFANPSYVFFRLLEGASVGNIQVPLTAERSMATDHRLFPRGAPGIVATTAPVFDADGQTVTGWRPDIRFTVNQDTGGAIRGAGRVDLFLGFGPHAENWAGVMKQPDSRLYFIAPL